MKPVVSHKSLWSSPRDVIIADAPSLVVSQKKKKGDNLKGMLVLFGQIDGKKNTQTPRKSWSLLLSTQKKILFSQKTTQASTKFGVLYLCLIVSIVIN